MLHPQQHDGGTGRPHRAGRIIVSVILMALASALDLTAQEARGTIQGRVVDASGGAMPGATVEVLNVATGVVTPTTTNDEGSYRVPFLIPGNYTVTVTLAGFSKFVSDNIEVHVADLLTVDATLEGRRDHRRGDGHRHRGHGRPHHRRARAGRRRAPDRGAADSRGQPGRAGHPGAGRDGDDRPAVAQGRVQQRALAVLDRRRRREEERLHHRRRVERRQRSRRLQPAVGVGRGVQDPHDVVRRGDRQHDGRGRQPRDQERHQHDPRAGLRVVPRRGARRAQLLRQARRTARSATTRTTGSAPRSAARSSRTGPSTSPTSKRIRSRCRRRTS